MLLQAGRPALPALAVWLCCCVARGPDAAPGPSTATGSRQSSTASSPATSAPVLTDPAVNPSLCLPSLAKASALRMEKSTGPAGSPAGGTVRIDGIDTDAPWPEYQTPSAYAVCGGRYLIEDAYRDLLYLWEPSQHRLTRLGQGRLAPVPRLGRLVSTYQSEHLTLSDVDPALPRLRAWLGPSRDIGAAVVGSYRGSPLILSRGTGGTGASGRSSIELLELRSPGAPEVHRVDTPAPMRIASADSVRGERLLLVGNTSNGATRWQSGAASSTFTAEVWVASMDRGQLRAIGQAQGAWSMGTAIPHPYVTVVWSDHDPSVPFGWPSEGCRNTVGLDDERVQTQGCSP
ncbi:MAG: hypothetical protein HY898_21910 [Deltaproteobacteria bacterium]|nr:hypothetical protein [Deltaproteobacteria bacterium]